MLERLRSLPGVTAAGATSRVPMTGGLHGVPIFPPGTTDFALNNAVLSPYVFSISPGYLEAAGTRLLEGRDVSGYDTAQTPFVAVVNTAFARKMWGQESAIGQRFIVSGRLTEVVGVAEDGKYHDLQEDDPTGGVPAMVAARGASARSSWSAHRGRRGRPRRRWNTPWPASMPDTPITVQSWSDALGLELFPAWAATVALGTTGRCWPRCWR